MQNANDFLVMLDGYIGGHTWFVVLLHRTGVFFTIYPGFPQFRYFRYAIEVVKRNYDHAHYFNPVSYTHLSVPLQRELIFPVLLKKVY